MKRTRVFIAGIAGAIDWLSGHGGAEDSFTSFFAEIGSLLMGRRAFHVVSGFAGADRRCHLEFLGNRPSGGGWCR